MLLKNCSSILLADDEKGNFISALQRPGISSLYRKGILKKVHEKCKKTPRCHKCGGINGLLIFLSFSVFCLSEP